MNLPEDYEKIAIRLDWPITEYANINNLRKNTVDGTRDLPSCGHYDMDND